MNESREQVQARLRAFFLNGEHEQIVAVAHQAARNGRATDLPATLPTRLRDALRASGITSLYGHQRAAYELLRAGQNVVVSTGTGSGKSLCYQLAVLESRLRDEQSRALLLFPTKALTQDQARKLGRLSAGVALPVIYDGDTPREDRPLLRRRGAVLLTNPDMLHVGILPNHERWAEYLHHLDFVVLDEAHVYRGVFGSHVAQVLRRLRRICEHYGSRPRFVLTSATIANPHVFAERLTGLPFIVVDEDQAFRPERTIVFWNPPLVDHARGERRGALAEAAYVTAECILAGARVVTFAPTRKAAELVYRHVSRRLDDRDPGAARSVQPYRAGYTAQQRREIERRLFNHDLDGVIATQALELGIDVGALDVAIVTGFPGTVTSLLQRWGRAGRRGHGWAVLIAGQDALDQYFMREPERLLGRAVEEAIIDLSNPYVSAPHLEAAAYERPITTADTRFFGEAGLALADRLVQAGRLRDNNDGSIVWTRPHAPVQAASLRTASNEQFIVVESRSGEIIGFIERERVFRFAHPGAIYLHLGAGYIVRHLDLVNLRVFVEPFEGAYYTQAKIEKDVLIAGQAGLRTLTGASLFLGEVQITEQVIAYQRRDVTDQHVIDTVALDLPQQVYTTQAFWLAVTPQALASIAAGIDETAEAALAGGLHAAEHALIALLPLYAMCDRWDIGGLSTPWHWQTDTATIFVYDGYPGGIGLTRRGYDAFESLAADALELVDGCPCRSGCPSCIQSPKCGNLNEPLSKQGAVALLRALLGNCPTA